MKKVMTGLNKLEEKEFSLLKNRNIGLLCNQASINNNFKHIIDIILPYHNKGQLCVKTIFGPQHGLWGHTQDNMIEWEGKFKNRFGIPICSLYGKYRKPTPEMLDNIDLLMIDLQDVGSRYYTFVWTMALCMEACAEQGKEVWILDRPNPIGGDTVEGIILGPDYSSFVGLFPLIHRHGLTIGEIALYLQDQYFKELIVKIIHLEFWERKMYFEHTGLSWVMPSPNMPLVETAMVYPGMCLLEGTNLSEGRGTTRPFEIFGAPWIDGYKLALSLNKTGLAGVHFRPVQFQPTFQKYTQKLCEGCFIHVTNRLMFKPVLTAITLLSEVVKQYPKYFSWRKPPYEYEFNKLPIDILAGHSWLREYIESNVKLSKISEKLEADEEIFKKTREGYLIYD
jgi:uncharacterized protein YbbC (DUF1343 family)